MTFLYNPTSDYGNADVHEWVKGLDPRITAVRVESDGIVSFPTSLFSRQKFWSNHHQKFLCVDKKRIMVTGVDINRERMGWLKPNMFDYYWHELSIVLPVSPAMMSWLTNHLVALDLENTPAPLLTGGFVEHDLMVDMIRTAKHSLQLENQAWVSGPSPVQHNRISEAIVERIVRAVEAGPGVDDFKAVLATNIGQDDEPSPATRWFARNAVMWSYAYVQKVSTTQPPTHSATHPIAQPDYPITRLPDDPMTRSTN